MKLNNSRLIIRQLDKRLQNLAPLRDIEYPKEGWIALVRKTLNMSLRQLGGRLSISPQGMAKVEKSESEGSITLNNLREAGEALNMKLVYGFIPREGSLEKMIENQAKELAQKIVMRTSTTMKLEDQENSDQRIKEAIAEMTEEFKREMPKSLWD
ncbi:mobile mystery protein A [Gynurincola endophyticus]|uniref:mobile mystery protein A n=1 Tax=Gynurincola endophyticus TaxID=2479004 RepID=UPI000F8D25E4|nr:mobile mystery protein A [Gynurincola endophyticus]